MVVKYKYNHLVAQILLHFFCWLPGAVLLLELKGLIQLKTNGRMSFSVVKGWCWN